MASSSNFVKTCDIYSTCFYQSVNIPREAFSCVSLYIYHVSYLVSYNIVYCGVV